MAFTTLVLFQLFSVFNARSDKQSAFHGLFRNKWLWGSVGLSLSLQVAVIYLPFLQAAFSTVSLSVGDWLFCVVVASSVLWLRELSKIFVRAKDKEKAVCQKATQPKQTTSPPEGPSASRAALSQELRALAGQFANRPVRLGEILEATKGRGFHLLLVFVALPFLTPIPLPGFSIPFGLVVAIIGARMALGQQPWLPQKLLSRELPAGFLAKLLAAASRVVKFLEWFLRPRLLFLHEQLIYRRLAGVLIALSGLYLVLPLPVPFSNGLPAWTVLLLSAAALSRDGLCFIAGCVMFVLATTFFVLLAIGGTQLVEQLHRLWAGGAL